MCVIKSVEMNLVALQEFFCVCGVFTYRVGVGQALQNGAQSKKQAKYDADYKS